MKSSCSPCRLRACQKPGEPLSACLILLSPSLFSSLHPFPKVSLPQPAERSHPVSLYTTAKTLIQRVPTLLSLPLSGPSLPDKFPSVALSLSISKRPCNISHTTLIRYTLSVLSSQSVCKVLTETLNDHQEARRLEPASISMIERKL